MNSTYLFYLGSVLLPVTPEKITWKYDNDDEKITLMNTGEVNILNPIRLVSCSFDILLPGQRYPFAVYENSRYQPIAYYLNAFSTMMDKRTVIPFHVIRTSTSSEYEKEATLNMTMDSYTVKEDAGQGVDVIVSLELKEYKYFNTVHYVINTVGEMEKKKERPVSQEKEEKIPEEENIQSYTVVKGDCLYTICKRFYGNGEKYREVAERNGITNPNVIYPGQVITLA